MSDHFEPDEWWVRRIREQAEEIKRLIDENAELRIHLEKAQSLTARNSLVRTLNKLLEDANRGAERNAHVNQLLAADLLQANGELDAWRKLVLEHNTLRNAQCRNCRETCGDCCPAAYVIHVPPELEQSP